MLTDCRSVVLALQQETRSDWEYADAVYADVLDRTVDATGLGGWTAGLNGNRSRSDVAAAILGSAESNLREVQDSYRTLLGRQADPIGSAAFTALLNAGISDEIARAFIAGSQEYFQRATGTR